MSSQTDVQNENAASEATQADEIAALGLDQLKQLQKEHQDAGNDAAAAALQNLIDEREKLDAAKAKLDKKDKEKPKSRKGSRAPKGRQVAAAKSFNADADQLARLQEVMKGVVQEDGTYKMTPELIQLGISAYYDERRREGASPKASKDTKTESAPIIPDATPAAPEAAADTTSEATPTSEAPAPQAGGDGAEASDTTEAEPQATAGPPFNPYGSESEEDDLNLPGE